MTRPVSVHGLGGDPRIHVVRGGYRVPVNQGHNELCGGPEWAEYLSAEIMPKVLDEVDLGDDLLEIGPGFGMATQVLQGKVARVTAVEIDPEYARALAERFAGSNVQIVEGDGTDLQFDDASFSAAASFTMLHHMPLASQQDAMFAEVARVLRPGGVLVGSDSLDGVGFRVFHEGDICNPVDPDTLGDRLETAGFSEHRVTVQRSVDDEGDENGTVFFVART